MLHGMTLLDIHKIPVWVPIIQVWLHPVLEASYLPTIVQSKTMQEELNPAMRSKLMRLNWKILFVNWKLPGNQVSNIINVCKFVKRLNWVLMSRPEKLKHNKVSSICAFGLLIFYFGKSESVRFWLNLNILQGNYCILWICRHKAKTTKIWHDFRK